MHAKIPDSFARAFATFGAELYLAGHTFNPGNSDGPFIHYGRKWSQEEIDKEIGLSNVRAMEVEELLDNPPDIFMIMCAEQQADQIVLWERIKDKSKLVWYSGNDNTGNIYRQDLCRNLLAADTSSYSMAVASGKHTLNYYPWIDYEKFAYTGVSDVLAFGTYINNYQKLFPNGYNVAQQAMNLLPQISWKVVDGAHHSTIPSLLAETSATIHCKELEGYGYSILESLAAGRPVILFRPFSHNRSYRKWCLDFETALYLESASEFNRKVGKFVIDAEFRHNLQESAARLVREIINNEEQSSALADFLERLS